MSFLALIAYLVFAVIRPQEFVPGLAGVPVVKFSLLLVAGSLLFQKEKRFSGAHALCLIGLPVAAFMSRAANGWVGGGISAAQEIVTTAVLPFFVIAAVLNSRRKLEVVMHLLVFSAVVMVSNGITQMASPDGLGWAGVSLTTGRITWLGIFNDPNDLSMFLVMTLPLAFYLLPRSSFPLKVALVGAILLIVYGVYLTNSRGGLLGLMALAGFWFFLRYGAARSAMLVTFVLPVALFAMSKFREIDPDEASAAGRIEAWYEGIQMLFWKPLFGVGHGAFVDFHHLTAHNSFVLVFAELGILGYLSWFGFVFFCSYAVTTLWRPQIGGATTAQVPPDISPIGKSLTFSIFGFLVTGFFLSRAHSPILYVYCGLMIAAFYNGVSNEQMQKFYTVRANLKPLLIATSLSVFAIYVIVKLFA